jgi:hypothetical protein
MTRLRKKTPNPWKTRRKRRPTRKQRGGNNYFLPKIAWAYWDSDAPPPPIKDIMKHRPAKLHGWKSMYLTDKTIDNYIDSASYPPGYDKLIPAHKADWIRLALIEKYGGTWLDAGIIVNDVSELNKIHGLMIKESPEAGLFYLENHGFHKNMPLYIDNWFIIAPKQSQIIIKWKKEFEKAIIMGLVEYKTELMQQHLKIEIFDKKDMTDTYLSPQACLQKVIQTSPIAPKILFLDPAVSMFKIHSECSGRPNRDPNEDEQCVQDKLLNDPKTKELPHIKLRSDDRGSAERGHLDLTDYFKSP